MKPWVSKALKTASVVLLTTLVVGVFVPRSVYAGDTGGVYNLNGCIYTKTCTNNSGSTSTSATSSTGSQGNTQSSTPTSTSSNQSSSSSDATDYENQSDVKAEFDNAGFVEKMIGGLIAGLSTGILKIGQFVPIDQLAFGVDTSSVQVFATTSDGKSEFDAIKIIYWGFFTLASILMIVNVIRYGLKIASQGSNPRSRSTIGGMVIDFTLGFVLLCFSWFIVYYASDWNVALCQWLQPYKIDPNSSLSSMKVLTGDYLTSEIVRFVMIGMSVFFNILYALRKYLLIGFVIIGPLIALAYAGGNKEAFSVWLSETITNAFMPFSHALVLAMYFRLNYWASQNHAGLMSKWWVPIVTLFFLVPVSKLFRKMFGTLLGQLLGINEELTAAAGLGGLMGVAGALSMGGSLLSGAKGGSKTPSATTTKGNMSQGGAASGGSGGDGGGLGLPSAGANERGSSPSAISTGIGQVSNASSGALNMSKGLGTMQSAIGKGQNIGSSVLGGAGKALGGAVGASLDLGAMAMGQRTNFRSMGARTGGALGNSAGSMLGGSTGAAIGRNQAIRQEQKNAMETGTTRSEQNISRSTALNRAMGLNQSQNNGYNQGASRQQRALQEKNAKTMYRGTMAAAAMGGGSVSKGIQGFTNWRVNRSMSKGLEQMGNLKGR